MFVEKLNRKQEGAYVIEEEKLIVNDGVWEGFLAHDNVIQQSISIYTGPKFTGKKVENYFISTPSETPWKTHLKVFSNSQKIYITYETIGDQVEAEDVNLLQEVVTDTVKELGSYKDISNREIKDLKNRTTVVEETKADKVYVDKELLKKYDKDKVFTKEEVLQKIQDLIGTAPEALDTLAEIAEALNNDPNFAATMTNELSKKADKVAGKGLSDENYTLLEKQKLAGIEIGANKYVHPTTHSANIIVENEDKRFVSDIEKVNWNDSNSKKHTHSNKSILDKITQILIDNWNNAVEHIKDTVRHVTQNDKDNWNGKAEVSQIPTKVGQLENDKKYITQSELGNAGYGDMTRAQYDANKNGIVDRAELADSVSWAGVTGKPTTFMPSSHGHSIANITGLQIALDGTMKKGPLTWNDLKGV